ncbi:C-Myc-binding protein homolog isoform X2 [Carica papaya]|uniref:C-Myc-binding protein homolog isoform X2 n=1 Tax=Carica papaya TaxID=3649 RepID=UPI000B8D1B2F|nr:C-Myc-binding protein homolog isoform X2 [Carica papaya]
MMRYKEWIFFTIPIIQEKEAKKEAFRKYLESSGAVDALTKVLVALYEQNEKPSSALEFIQQKLGGPTASEYEKLQAEVSDLQVKYNELLATHQQICKELEELKNSHTQSSVKETNEGDPPTTASEGQQEQIC